MLLTLEMMEHMVIDEAGSLRAAVAVIDPDKGAKGTRGEGAKAARLELAVVLEQAVGLNDGHGEVTADVLTGVSVPQKALLTATRIGVLI